VVLSGLINDPKIPTEEKKAWIETAKDCSKNELQDKIADTRPDVAAKNGERKRKVSRTLTEVKFLVTDDELEAIQNLQSILGKLKLKDTILSAIKDVTERKDQVKQAERAKAREGKKKPEKTSASHNVETPKKPDHSLSKTQARSSRPKTPAATRHQVDLRDLRRCTHVDPKTGDRCDCRFGLEYHHYIPLANGDTDTAENIFTLCRDHHKQEHINY
jgi:hypothetical protein